jgi:hypothetical protein
MNPSRPPPCDHEVVFRALGFLGASLQQSARWRATKAWVYSSLKQLLKGIRIANEQPHSTANSLSENIPLVIFVDHFRGTEILPLPA